MDMVVCVFEVTLSDAFTHAGNCISAQLSSTRLGSARLGSARASDEEKEARIGVYLDCCELMSEGGEGRTGLLLHGLVEMALALHIKRSRRQQDTDDQMAYPAGKGGRALGVSNSLPACAVDGTSAVVLKTCKLPENLYRLAQGRRISQDFVVLEFSKHNIVIFSRDNGLRQILQ